MANEDNERYGRISTIAKAALTVTAGAAFLYRAGGSRFLSSGLDRLNYALRETGESVFSNKSFDEINGRGREVLKSAFNTFKDSYSNYKNDGIRLRLDNSNSLLNSIQEAVSLEYKQGETFLSELFNKQEFIPGLKRQFQEVLGEDYSEKRISDMVDSLMNHMTDYLEERSVVDNADWLRNDYLISDKFRTEKLFDLNISQIEKINNVVNKAFLNKEEDRLKFIEQQKDLVYEIYDKLLDKDSLAQKFGRVGEESAEQKRLSLFLGDKQATIRDILEHKDQIKDRDFISKVIDDSETVIKRLELLVQKDEGYLDLYVDPTLRIKDGELRSFENFSDIKRKAEEQFMYTLPGKLLKPLEVSIHEKQAPNLILSAKGTTDYMLPKLLEGNVGTVLQNSYIRINKQGFRINGTRLEREETIDRLIPTSGRYGFNVRMFKNISGDMDEKVGMQNFLEKVLDMNTSPKFGIIGKVQANVRKIFDPKWGKNIIEDALENSDYLDYEGIEKIGNILKKSTHSIDRVTAAQLKEKTDGFAVKNLFHLLTLSDNDLIETMSGKEYKYLDKFINKDLANLINKYQRHPQLQKSLISISSAEISPYGINKEITTVKYLSDLFRKEISKESLLQLEDLKGTDEVYKWIKETGLSYKKQQNMRNLFNYSLFEKATSFYSSVEPRTEEEKFLSLQKVAIGLLNNTKSETIKKEFRNTLKEVAQTSYGLLDDGMASDAYKRRIVKGHRPNDFIYIQKSISPLDIIKSENKVTTAKAFAKQFVAGRNDMENFTTMSLYPYFMLHRLTDPISLLTFSSKSTGSVGDLAKNIMLKRVLPVAAGVTMFNYLDFESRNFTGKGLKEAALNSFANFNIGIRKIRDKFGDTEDKKNEYYTNPGYRYFHDAPYKTASELSDWYKNGYKPVRKGRWWGLSTSEFRGGKIEYFEPSALKQASVPWKEIAIYGSQDEKWKHSWIPTPRHPLAPLRKLIDPYWEERKHYYDMPYPVTAPLFSEGTPWAAVGNMTLGNILKPQRKMHRSVLGNNMIDVRSIIADQNARIKNKQKQYITLTGSDSVVEGAYIKKHKDNRTAAQIRGNTYKLVESKNTLIDGTEVVEDGTKTDFSVVKQPSKIHSFEGILNSLSSVTGYSTGAKQQEYTEEKLNFIDKLILRSTSKNLPIIQIQKLNEGIKYKAATRGQSQTGFAKRYDNMLYSYDNDYLRDKDILNEVKSYTSTKQYITDLGYSIKELSGIYGFAFDELMPSKKHFRMENANNLTSFSKRFWDESIGGIGGGVMEIARRFFPHANRNVIDLNPIRNTMPSWMPERFQYGNPYTKVKKGEIRLPGKAYDAMYHLAPQIDYKINPHMIGASTNELVHYFLNKSQMDQEFDNLPINEVNISQRDINKTQENIEHAKRKIDKLIKKGIINSGEFYSDFQRFKILADVAPWSQEYKAYKSKISDSLKTYDDKKKKEYYDILDRVEKQSTNHDFYNYLYRGNNFKTKSGYIDKIKDDTFTLVGSEQVYRMAGIKTNEDGLKKTLKEGMQVQLTYDDLDKNNTIIKSTVKSKGENLNRMAIRNKVAERSVSDNIDAFALSTASSRLKGSIVEIIGHMPIPYLHNRHFKLETPIESYENEQVYGTHYSTWSHPIKGYIQPAFNKSMNAGTLHAVLGAASFAANVYINDISKEKAPVLIRKAVQAANTLITPGAMTGTIIGTGITLSPHYAKAGTYIASSIWATSYLYNKGNNPIVSTLSGATLGKVVGEFMEKGEGNKYAQWGALTGAIISGLKGKEKEKWIPKDTKKRWELEEYFDRLEYLKYQRLYEKAAMKAKRKEHVNIKKYINDLEKEEEKNKKKNEKLLNYKEKISNNYLGNTIQGRRMLNKINNELNDSSVNSVTIKAGKYTKAALAYKQAMDSTVFGLKKDASWAQILRALPSEDRDYFLEFAKVRKQKERKRILKNIAPYKRNILHNIWNDGKKEKVKSNSEFFKSHKLPNMFWNGWKPDVDLQHVEMKTIENEGMLLSDFGLYDSSKEEPNYQFAPGIKNFKSNTNILSLRASLMDGLNQIGLTGVNVSIEESSQSGLQIISDFVKITDYNVKKSINNLFGRNYY